MSEEVVWTRGKLFVFVLSNVVVIVLTAVVTEVWGVTKLAARFEGELELVKHRALAQDEEIRDLHQKVEVARRNSDRLEEIVASTGSQNAIAEIKKHLDDQVARMSDWERRLAAVGNSVDAGPDISELRRSTASLTMESASLRDKLSALERRLNDQPPQPGSGSTQPSRTSTENSASVILGIWDGRDKKTGKEVRLEITATDHSMKASIIWPEAGNTLYDMDCRPKDSIAGLQEERRAEYVGIANSQQPTSYFELDTPRHRQGGNSLLYDNALGRAHVAAGKLTVALFQSPDAGEPTYVLEASRRAVK